MRTPDQIDSIYTENDLIQKISSISYWHHKIHLGSRIITPGKQPDEVEKSKISALPKDLTGKTVLDVGMWDGFYSFECEKRNAREILGIDIFQTESKNDPHESSFYLCKEILNSKVQFKNLDIFNIESLHKTFDIILFYGVYYHLVDPFTVIQKLYNVCDELLLVEGLLLSTPEPICSILEHDQVGINKCNYFVFSPSFLEKLAKLIGFKKTEFLGYSKNDRPIPNDNKTHLKLNRGTFRLYK